MVGTVLFSFNFFCPTPLQWGSVYSCKIFYPYGGEIHPLLMWNRYRKPTASMCLYKNICWCSEPFVNICTQEPCWILKAPLRTLGRIINRTLTCKTNSPSADIFWYFNGNYTVCLNPTLLVRQAIHQYVIPIIIQQHHNIYFIGAGVGHFLKIQLNSKIQVP